MNSMSVYSDSEVFARIGFLRFTGGIGRVYRNELIQSRDNYGTNLLSLSLDFVSLGIYSSYHSSGDSKHDQGRHRQRSVENRRHHQGQGRGGRRRGLRRDADLHAARRTDRTARVRRLPGEAAQARHRAEPTHRQGSPDPAGPDHSLQTRQRPAEHRIIVSLDPLRDDAGLLPPPAHVWARRPKFQDRVWLHALLFVLTLASTTLVGASHWLVFRSNFAPPGEPVLSVDLLVRGLWYSGTLVAILGCHELGHYFACRYYDVDASLPFFMPAPMLVSGTLGAFIRIREPFPSKRILFDV